MIRFGTIAILAASVAGAQDLSLQDLQGGPRTFAFAKASATVVLFVSTKCPVSNRYSDRMTALYKAYSDKDVQFVFVNANDNEPAAEVEQHSREARYPFPVYKDVNNALADKLNAQWTPETYVFDRAGKQQYHGRIDDAQNIARVKEESLRLAIDAVLAGAAPSPSDTRALGCTIKRVRPS